MTSAIDSTKPTALAPLTADVRSNFAIAASEITALQAGTVPGLAAPTGSGLVGFSHANTYGQGTEGLALQSLINVKNAPYNAKGDGVTDDTTAVAAAIAASQYIFLPPASNFKVTNLAISRDTTVYSFGGTITASGATDVAFSINSGAKLRLVGVNLVGGRPGIDSNTTNSGVVVNSGTLEAARCVISGFAYCGIIFTAGGSDSATSTIHSRTIITNCGTGVWLGDYEYTTIDNCEITSNGLNAAGTAWSAVFGAGTGYGIYGRFANTHVSNNLISNNAVGLYMNSIGGSNPDHNKIIGNTINHNFAAGAVLQGLQSYETIMGNTFLSNVTRGAAPTVVYSPRSTSVDLSIVDCIGMNFIGNDVSVGSDTLIPIYGHARCRYIGNNWIYGVPTELRVPQTGAAIFDVYGYSVNADNTFSMGMTRSESIAGLYPSLMASSIRTVIDKEIESLGAGAGSGGGTQNDNVVYKFSYLNGWTAVGASIESHYYRQTRKQVHFYIYATAPASPGTVIANFPVGFRPVVAAQINAAQSNALAHTYATVYATGDVTIVGATANQLVLIHGSFVTSY